MHRTDPGVHGYPACPHTLFSAAHCRRVSAMLGCVSLEDQPKMIDYSKRNYDVAFPLQVRITVQRRRNHPTGEIHAVKMEERGDDVVQLYPWSKMLLGDFFVAKIGNRSVKAMKMTFTKAAQRRDIEISVKRVKDADGDQALQVTLTYFEVSVVRKRAASLHGVDNILVHDHNHAKAKRRHREKERPKRSHKKLKRERGEPVYYPKPDPTPKDAPLEQPLMTIEEMRAYALRPGAGE